MKLTNRKKLWIHRDEDCNDLRVCGDWMCGEGPNKFTYAEAEQLFELIRDTVQAKYPNIVVNPWSDAQPGTLD